MKIIFFPRLLRPRRIFMRPWRRKLGVPFLVGSIIGTLLITYFGKKKAKDEDPNRATPDEEDEAVTKRKD